jgi:GDPmannose 4,6-dehydratase
VTGQDGSYLAEHLLNQGHEVFGLNRRTSLFNTQRVDHIFKDVHIEEKGLRLVHGDMSDAPSLQRAIHQVGPDRIFNLASQSHVAVSFEEPEYTANSTGLGTLRILETLRNLDHSNNIRFYQASSSELFGGQTKDTLNEDSPFLPRSPYAAAKLYAHNITSNYREAFNIFAVNGILFNHESPRRGATFVTRKITLGVSKIANGSKLPIFLGNLDAVRDWGHAKDYVRAMSMMLEAEVPKDYVVATGEGHTVRDFLIKAFEVVDVFLEFEGTGPNEKIINKANGQILAEVDSRYFRPLEVGHLIGDSSRIRQELNWLPEITFDQLVEEMVLTDLKTKAL